MQELKRDNLGFIDLDALGCVCQNGTVIIYGELFYFKFCDIGAYKELVIDELAKDFGIRCAFYDLASFGNGCGLISKDLNADGKFVSMSDLLSGFYKTASLSTTKQYNNLYDIGFMLEQSFDHKTFQRLNKQLEELYLFDILTGNSDRNVTNYGLQYHDGTVDIVILDNERCMDSDVIYEDKFQLKRRRNDDGISGLSWDIVNDRLKFISDEHIDEVLGRVEQKIHGTINDGIKCKIKSFFKDSRTVISKKIPKQSVKNYQM